MSGLVLSLPLVASLGLACVSLTPPWAEPNPADSGAGGWPSLDGGRSVSHRDDGDDTWPGAGGLGGAGTDGAGAAGGSDGQDALGGGGSFGFGGKPGGDAAGVTGAGGAVAAGGNGDAARDPAEDSGSARKDVAMDDIAGTTDDGADAANAVSGDDAGDDASDGPFAGSDGRDTRVSIDASCPLCALGLSLVHRYSFNGTGTVVADSVGTAKGTAVSAQLSGSGTLVLAGGSSGDYVDLPNHLLSSLTDATLEVWVTWNGGAANQRILDFGSNALSGGKYQATTTVIISPNSAPQGIPPRLRASYSNQVSLSGTFVDSSGPLPTGTMNHVVAVFDGQRSQLSLYLNGVLVGQTGGLSSLSLINDVNDWLGRSQYSDDPGFSGTYYELRIYDAALTAEQVKASFTAGPDAQLGPAN